ncbi:MAG TPA: glycosyltransferase [Blastocatellia bacterium]|nr:glycosyltransferase [Blastocatellia bacterium]
MRERRPRILHVLPWPSVGGTELATLRIAQATGDRFDHVALCLSEAGEVRDLFAHSGFETFSFTAVEPSLHRPAAYLRASLHLARQLRAHGVELMHCADVLAAHYTALAGRLAQVPVLCHVRNRFAEITRRDRVFLRPVSHFAFVSHHTWQQFDCRVAPGRGSVLYDGIDPPPDFSEEERRKVRAELGLSEQARVIGMVARVAPQKDYATLARAAARVITVYPDARFLIVGDHSQTAAHREHYREVQALLAASGVASQFVFTGFRADVPRLISVMDLFVLSTHCEGLPLVILEAMAQGKPVIATAVDGIPELVRHKENGLLFAHKDEAALAGHLLSLLGDSARATRLGAAGRRVVISEFSREQFAANVTKLYCGLLKRKSQFARYQPDWQPAAD